MAPDFCFLPADNKNIGLTQDILLPVYIKQSALHAGTALMLFRVA